MKIGIFIPIYFKEEFVKSCLESLITTDSKGIHTNLCIGVNGATEDFKQYLKTFVQNINGKYFTEVHVFEPDSNMGKPKLVNLMSAKYNDFDYLVSIDSDMVSLDSKWLKKFLYTFDLYRGKRDIGALCSQQLGNNCHFSHLHPHEKIKVESADKKFATTIITNSTNTGCAGGVLMTHRSVWNLFGAYYANNLYGSDDGHYSGYCSKYNKLMGYVEEIPFWHPYEDNEEYRQWKFRAAHNILKPEESKGFFENLRPKLKYDPRPGKNF